MLSRRTLRIVKERWRDLLAAQWALLEAHRALRICERGVLAAASGPRDLPGESDGPGPAAGMPLGDSARTSERRQEAERLAWSVDAVARRGLVRGECLVRSLALSRLLRDRGLPPGRIRVGVRRGGSAVEAHAWLEWEGRVLGDDEMAVRSFRAFESLDIAVPGVPGGPGGDRA